MEPEDQEVGVQVRSRRWMLRSIMAAATAAAAGLVAVITSPAKPAMANSCQDQCYKWANQAKAYCSQKSASCLELCDEGCGGEKCIAQCERDYENCVADADATLRLCLKNC